MTLNAWQAAYLATSAVLLIFSIAIPALILRDREQFTFNRQNRKRDR